MTNEELLAFKKRLEDMKSSIMADAERTLGALNAQSGNVPDPIDRASMESELSFELRLRERDLKLSKKIEAALKRINEGVYGICTQCGQEIAKERLEARPVTELCIDCKTIQEKAEKEQGL